ncbi:late competence protein ComER [Heyndrickxia acidiproducens]|uniref:late competence protein ComER n=1 Tax=Heyndrickxia acidiproducens TaxID=1121084 RepID=UPI00037FBCFE|nr:late competence protein ComER [Heyndrickxia acidiproducens]
MKLGVIGTGNMGSILIEALMNAKAITPSQLTITNRSPEKAVLLKKQYPDIQVAPIKETIESQDLILLCVKPLDMYPILKHYAASFKPSQCLVSITSPVTTEQLASVVPCSCVRAIPSITNRALSGAMLITYGKQCTAYWRNEITALFSRISRPIEIDQASIRTASDIVSCGPAFFSFLTQKMIEGATHVTDIDEDTAVALAAEMIIGMGELLKNNFYTLPALQEKVTVKGGITGEGLKVLERKAEGMFEELFQATHEKFKEDLGAVSRQFGIQS